MATKQHDVTENFNTEQRRHPDALLYSVEEAARIAGLGKTKFRELLATGEIDSLRVGRRVLVPRAELVRFANEGFTSERLTSDESRRLLGSEADAK